MQRLRILEVFRLDGFNWAEHLGATLAAMNPGRLTGSLRGPDRSVYQQGHPSADQ